MYGKWMIMMTWGAWLYPMESLIRNKRGPEEQEDRKNKRTGRTRVQQHYDLLGVRLGRIINSDRIEFHLCMA